MPEPIDPQEFPTLTKYPQKVIEEAIQTIMEKHGADRHNAICTLEMDLKERELLATGD